MSNQNQAKWNPSQFLETLNYFGEIPFLGSFRWLQQWLGQRPNFPGTTLSAMKNKVLVVEGEHTDSLDSLSAYKLTRRLQQKLGDSTDFLSCSWPCGRSQNAQQDDLHRQGDTFREHTEKIPPTLTALMRAIDTVVLLRSADDSDWIGDAVSFYTGTCRESGLNAAVVERVFDFVDAPSELAAWGSLDDVVMGGVSQGRFFPRDGQAVFAGTVSTDNSGGFSSVRTQNFDPPFNFSGWSGLQITVKGDGQRYKFIARNSGGWDSPAYIYGIDTVKDEWITVRIPFESMVATFRARSVPDAPAFDPANVFSFQLMLSKFEVDRQLNPHFSAGSFELLVSDIGVYRSRRGLPLVVVSSQQQGMSLQQQTVLKEADIDYRVIEAPQQQSDEKSLEVLTEAITSVLK